MGHRARNGGNGATDDSVRPSFRASAIEIVRLAFGGVNFGAEPLITSGKHEAEDRLLALLRVRLKSASLREQGLHHRLPGGVRQTGRSSGNNVPTVGVQPRRPTDLRIALVRHPDFAKKVRSIVVEFGSTSEQSTLDRYIRGENVSMARLQEVWKTTTAGPRLDSPFFADFFAAVRDVNARLPADARVRVFGGDPGPGDHRSRETAAVSVLKEQVLQKHGKALVVYGAAHFYRTMPRDYLSSVGEDIGIARTLEIDYPGRTFVVIPVGGRLDLPPGVAVRIDPDYQKFDRAITTKVRPVLVPLQRLPFQDFTAEEFIGGTLLTCRGPGGCVSVFKGSTLTLGQMADACVYVGQGADLGMKAKPAR